MNTPYNHSPFNPLRDIIQRSLFLFCIPLLFVPALLFVAAVIGSSAQLFFAGTMSVAALLYICHLQNKYWTCPDFDDLLDDLDQEFPIRETTDEEIELLLRAVEKWDGQPDTRPESLLSASSAHRHKHKGHSHWDN